MFLSYTLCRLKLWHGWISKIILRFYQVLTSFDICIKVHVDETLFEHKKQSFFCCNSLHLINKSKETNDKKFKNPGSRTPFLWKVETSIFHRICNFLQYKSFWNCYMAIKNQTLLHQSPVSVLYNVTMHLPLHKVRKTGCFIWKL